MHFFLFHRDLRLIDNTTLIYQLKKLKKSEDIISIFIFPPEQIDPKKNDYFSNNSVQFMIDSLHELSDDIKKKNGKMYFFKGDTMDVLKAIHKKVNIESIGYNLDYTPYARKRDNDIRTWCNESEIACYEKEDYLLYDLLEGATKKADDTPYLVYTPFLNHCLTNLKVRPIDKFKKFKFKKSQELKNIKYYIKENTIDNFYEENPDINVHGGRIAGLAILKGLGKFTDYAEKRDTLTYRTTQLSAYNHFSCVSIREVYFKILEKLGKKSNIIRELIWRDFFSNIIYFFPKVLAGQLARQKSKCLDEKYEKIKWSYNKKIFEKWCQGQTGYVMVDAAQRELIATGYMHNRARLVVSGFLVKHLQIYWRWGEKWFANNLVDYSPMMNEHNWEFAVGSGASSSPYFRIMSPIIQLQKFDPNCDYVRKWLPELNSLSNEEILNWHKPEIHEKYLKELKDKINYYAPIVDHDEQRKKILKLYRDALK